MTFEIGEKEREIFAEAILKIAAMKMAPMVMIVITKADKVEYWQREGSS